MAVLKKIAGLVAGVSAVAVFGVAVAQGVPPNPFVTNPALAAGQQSSHITPMGETGIPGSVNQVQTAQVTTVREVARVEAVDREAGPYRLRGCFVQIADGQPRDRAQVEVTTSRFAELDRADLLGTFLSPPATLSADERANLLAEEGWIAGAGHDALLAELRSAA